MEKPQYTRHVGQKFNEDGSVRTFPGNTCISKVVPEMPIYSGLLELQNRLKALDVNGKYGFLPPSSFHMTVIEGVCDQFRKPELWSSKLPLDMPLNEVTKFVLERYRKLTPPTSLRMQVARTYFEGLLLVILQPADAVAAKALKDFRDQFAEETGIRFRNHDNYTFHISLAYRLIEMTPEEEQQFVALQEEAARKLQQAYPVFEMRKPSLTTFENMFQFDDIC